MGKEQVSYVLLFVLAIFLIVIGVQGNLGTTIAILFTPDQIQIEDN